MAVSFFVRGWGGRIFDNSGGADLMISRMGALDPKMAVLDCKWNEQPRTVARVAADFKRNGGPVCGVGVSCGANMLSWIQTELKKLKIDVAYAAWIQPSNWCGKYPAWPAIPDNVEEAIVFYGGLITLGFGTYKPPLVVAPVPKPPPDPKLGLYDGKQRVGNMGKTKITWMPNSDVHPADFDRKGVQDPILKDMARVLHPTLTEPEQHLKVHTIMQSTFLRMRAGR